MFECWGRELELGMAPYGRLLSYGEVSEEWAVS